MFQAIFILAEGTSRASQKATKSSILIQKYVKLITTGLLSSAWTISYCYQPIFSVWSKIIILCSLPLTDTSPERQEEVEDMAVKMFRHGDKCVLYNLSFCNVWKDWDSTKTDYLRHVLYSQNILNSSYLCRMAKEQIPAEMRSLSRTARNLSFLLPFVDKVLSLMNI